MNPGEYFRQLRESQHLSINEVAIRCGLNRTTVWKFESDNERRGSIRGPTLKKMVTQGLRYSQKSKEFQQMLRLWTSFRARVSISDEDFKAAGKRIDSDTDKYMAAIRPLIEKLSKEQRSELILALNRASVFRFLGQLNRLHEGAMLKENIGLG